MSLIGHDWKDDGEEAHVENWLEIIAQIWVQSLYCPCPLMLSGEKAIGNLSKVEKDFNLSSQVRKEVLWGGQGRADGDGTEDPGVYPLYSTILYSCFKD